ncbi:MAG TPA: O-antigen polymerase [Dermatophilaceae bacterium]|nr:O-antigen polymerase [Dermatophilaceae bacterium]
MQGRTAAGAIRRLPVDVLGLVSAAYLIAALVTASMPMVATAVLVAAAVVSYAVLSRRESSYLSASAVFSASWMITIALAQLRWVDYQQVWQGMTWVCLAAGHLMFVVGVTLGRTRASSAPEPARPGVSPAKPRTLAPREATRLFWVCMTALAVGLGCFALGVLEKGYIPLFEISRNPNAYFDFYTRYHTFVVASMVSVGPAYYGIRRTALSRWHKMALALSILILTFVLPILLVQRGTFLTTGLILAAAIYELSSRKLWVFVACVIGILAVYQGGSSLRGYSDAQLNEFFKPKTTQSEGATAASTAAPSSSATETTPPAPTTPTPSPGPTSPPAPTGTTGGRVLSPGQSFAYSYLTVSHDNFDLGVRMKQHHAWGMWTIQPFTTVVRLPFLRDAIAEKENYIVLPHLTTNNLISGAYYDFGLPGVLVSACLWGWGIARIERAYRRSRSPMALTSMGIALTPVALCFFAPWFSLFQLWLLWGTALLLHAALTVGLNGAHVGTRRGDLAS